MIIARFPKDDDFYATALGTLKKVQDDYLNFISEVNSDNSKSFMARYITSSQLPVVNALLTMEEQLEFLKTHSLDNVNFNDAELINSDCFSNKSIEHLMYYRNPQLPKAMLEKEFIQAVDTLLNKAKVNVLVYQNITEYLIDGFRKFGFDTIIDYIL